MVEIPAFDFKMQSGTLGGRFTTLEGLLVNIIEQVRDLSDGIRKLITWFMIFSAKHLVSDWITANL